MLEELSDYALVNKPKDALVNGNVTLKNSPNPQFGDRHYWNGPVTFIYPSQNGDSEIALKPGLLESVVAKSNGFGEKTDNNDEVCIANEKKFKVRRLHVLAGALALVLIATIATLIVVFTPSNYADNDHEDEGPLCIMQREDWHALNSTGKIGQLVQVPVRYVIISHTALEYCNNTDECKQQVLEVQSRHFGFGWSDIGYNFLVGGDGCAYVGRGWDKAGAHAKLFNNRSIGISFIGNFQHELPPRKQIVAAKLILEEGIRLNKLAPNYKLFTHNQVSITESPGAKLIENIKGWAHWSEYDLIKDSAPIQDKIKQVKIEETT